MTSESTFKIKKHQSTTSGRLVESCNWLGNYYFEDEPDRRTSNDDSQIEGEDVPDHAWNETERLHQEEGQSYDSEYTAKDKAFLIEQALERLLAESTSSELDRFKKDLVMVCHSSWQCVTASPTPRAEARALHTDNTAEACAGELGQKTTKRQAFRSLGQIYQARHGSHAHRATRAYRSLP